MSATEAEQSIANSAESYKVLALSTGHITKEDTDALNAAAADPEENMVMKRDTGWFIKLYYVPDISDQHSPAIKLIIKLAVNAGFQMIEFDGDAGYIDGLPTFDW
jgi:hypothetical protein